MKTLSGFAKELSGGQALDLGCGFGAVSIAVAKEFGMHVLAVDALEPLLRVARQRAERAGVADRVSFRCDDLRLMLSAEGRFDLVVWAAMGPLLGELGETLRQIRRVVRAGGLILLEAQSAVVNGMPDLAPARKALSSFGDELLREVAIPAWQLREAQRAAHEQVKRNADEVAARDPFHTATVLLQLERWRARAEGPGAAGEHVWLLRRK